MKLYFYESYLIDSVHVVPHQNWKVCEKKVLTPALLLTKAVGLEGFAVFSALQCGIQNSKSFLNTQE